MNMLMPQYLTLYRELGSSRIYYFVFFILFCTKKILKYKQTWGWICGLSFYSKISSRYYSSFFFCTIAHTQDNTFLGFVVGSSEAIAKSNKKIVKENKAILYAKYLSYCQSEVFYWFYVFFIIFFIFHLFFIFFSSYIIAFSYFSSLLYCKKFF